MNERDLGKRKLGIGGAMTIRCHGKSMATQIAKRLMDNERWAMTRERAIQMAAKCDAKADALTDMAKKQKRPGALQQVSGPALMLEAANLLYTCAEDYRQYVRDNPSKGTGL